MSKTRKERARRALAVKACIAVVLFCVCLALLFVGGKAEAVEEKLPTAAEAVQRAYDEAADWAKQQEEERAEANENELIEQALVSQGWLCPDIPLDYTTQDILRTICEEYGVRYELALGVVDTESDFNTEAVGADGHDAGLFQVRDVNFEWLNKKAGITDLSETSQNMRAGVYMLHTYLEKYGAEEKALMAYNMGPTGAAKAWAAGITSTKYSESVLADAEKWAAILSENPYRQ